MICLDVLSQHRKKRLSKQEFFFGVASYPPDCIRSYSFLTLTGSCRIDLIEFGFFN